MLSAAAAVVVGLVVVACLVAALLVVILRLRRRLQQGGPAGSSSNKADGQQEMEWDNSALNITVNPLDLENGLEDDDEFAHDGRFALSADELDDEYIAAPVADDVISGLAADELDEQTTRDKAECKELEWDDSTLSY